MSATTASIAACLFLLATVAADEFQPPPRVESGQGACLQAELIYPLDQRPTPQCHASTIVETPSGLVAAWFGGTHEKHPDVGIWVARHVDGRWSKPVQVASGAEGEDQDYACWNPVLFQAAPIRRTAEAKGPLLLFYKVGPSPSQWWGVLTTSDDDGQTWSEPRRLGRSEQLGAKNPNLIGPVKNKPIQLDDGTIFCPSSTEHQGWRVHFEASRDGGRSWAVIGPINDASRFDAIQPSVLEYGGGRMQILCRTRQNVVGQSWSEDGGKTWSELTATSLPNPNSGTDAVTLRDGRQLLVYNHTLRTPALNGRQMLNVALSQDGKDWRPVLTLEQEPRRAEFSYPAVIQTADGKVHITYTWQRSTVKHVVLDPARIP